MDTTLILIGVGCIIGAIIGGGVKLVQIELSQVTSLWRQSLLGLFGVVLVVSGMIAGGHLSFGGPTRVPASAEAKDTVTTAPETPIQNTVAQAATADAGVKEATKPPSGPAARGDDPAPTTPPASITLPSKVDIFWCVTGDGGVENQELANGIVEGLRATPPQLSRVRVRPLQQATNARADYGITANIVRYDPGEHPAAEAIARIATRASGAPFAAAHALPGTPSIDYLSVFVCAIH